MSLPSYNKRHMRGFAPEAMEHVRQRYEDSDEKVSSIAADFGVHSKTITTLAHKQGWKMRNDRAPRDLPAGIRLNLLANRALGDGQLGAAPAVVAEAIPVDQPNIAARLEQALEKELRRVEALRNEFGPVAGRSIEAERTARTLATLTETLFKVRRLRLPNQAGTLADDNMPADVDGFRHALAERMDAFFNGRKDTVVPAGAEPALFVIG